MQPLASGDLKHIPSRWGSAVLQVSDGGCSIRHRDATALISKRHKNGSHAVNVRKSVSVKGFPGRGQSDGMQPMAGKYLQVEGEVLRSEPANWTDDGGAVHQRQKLSLFTGQDRIDVITGHDDAAALSKARVLQVGAKVRLNVEVKSGKNKEADPVFVFLDDLTTAKS